MYVYEGRERKIQEKRREKRRRGMEKRREREEGKDGRRKRKCLVSKTELLTY